MSQTNAEIPRFRSIEAIAALITEGLYRLNYTATMHAMDDYHGKRSQMSESEAAHEAQAELHQYIVALIDRINIGDLNADAPERAIRVWVEEITPPDNRRIIGDVIVRGVKTFEEAIDQVSSRFNTSLSTKYDFHAEECNG